MKKLFKVILTVLIIYVLLAVLSVVGAELLLGGIDAIPLQSDL